MVLNYMMKQITSKKNEANIRMCMNLSLSSIYLNLFFQLHIQIQLDDTPLDEIMY